MLKHLAGFTIRVASLVNYNERGEATCEAGGEAKLVL